MNGTSGTSGVNGTSGSYPNQITNIIISYSGWTLVSGYYQYTYSNTGITSLTMVDVIPENVSVPIINAAQILPKTLSSSGAVILYSINAPIDDIIVSMIFTIINNI